MATKDQVRRYLTRHAVALPPWQQWGGPSQELWVVVAIPAYDEEATLLEVLESLNANVLGREEVEVLVCVNHEEGTPEGVREANRRTVQELKEGAKRWRYPVRVMDRASAGRGYRAGEGGVGRARRELLDAGLRRLAEVGRGREGLLVCLDGDSPVEAGYLDAVGREMAESAALAGIGRYRHRMPEGAEHRAAMVGYEGWVRYRELGLVRAGSPYGLQTLGSTLVMKGEGYARADGMPTRQALEDFYMVQKLVKAGGEGAVQRLKTPFVKPSSRLSDRVPRGTGPMLRRRLGQGVKETRVDSPVIFEMLEAFFGALPEFYRSGQWRAVGSELLEFWREDGVLDALSVLRAHSADERRFIDQVHRKVDGLRLAKVLRGLEGLFEPVTLVEGVGALLEGETPENEEEALRRLWAWETERWFAGK